MSETIQVTHADIFEVGDKVQIPDWPKWMYRMRLKMWMRNAIRRGCLWFGREVYRGRVFVITGVASGSVSVDEC